MTTDPFTTSARAEAERLTPEGTSVPVLRTERDNLVHMAEWARDHLAAQEISHEEVIAATLEMYVRSHQLPGRQTPFESLDHEGQVSWVKDGRAVLSAARAARRDEKGRP